MIRENETFKNIDYSQETPEAKEYENCRFMNCNFSFTDLSQLSFEECSFEDCDFSMTKLNNTAFREADFINCKLSGLHFCDCNPFSLEFRFTNCILDFSSFYKLKLKKIPFNKCQLKETDFAEADLSGAVFHECDLNNAVFDRTNIEKADFRTAFNYRINPEINKIKKAKFSHSGLAGLLEQYNIEIS